jgi:flagellar basal-body rod modification protein FlgD
MSSTINQLINPVPSTTSATPASSSNNQLGQDAFLKLLTTQLQNQDPLNPMDDTQSVAQLAQFSSVQAVTQLSDSFTAFQSNFAVMQSAGLLGKTVSAQSTDASGNVTTVSGTVKTISVVNGVPEFTLADANGNLITDSSGNALELPTSSILSIGTTPASTTTSGPQL